MTSLWITLQTQLQELLQAQLRKQKYYVAEIPKEIYVPPQKRQQIIDELGYINRMEYKWNIEIINLLDNTVTQPLKFGTTEWVETKNDPYVVYITCSHTYL